MKNILTIMKKELTRVFKDRRLLITTIILPGLLIYLMYSLMGSGIAKLVSDSEPTKYYICTISGDKKFEEAVLAKEPNSLFLHLKENQVEEFKQKVSDGTYDILIDAPAYYYENFYKAMEDNQTVEKQDITIYFNSNSNASLSIYNIVASVYSDAQNDYVKKQNADVITLKNSDIAIIEKDSSFTQFAGMMMPLLLIIFLFSGAMSIAPESIAGEKERGTIATLLVTPVKRSEIALGKIISLSIIAICSALSSFLGVMLSLPKLLGGGDISMSNVYGFGDYVILLFIIVSTVMVIIGLLSVISCYAKNIKEASTFILPFFFLSMLLGISTMFIKSDNPLLYFIPIFNSVQAISSVFNMEANMINIIMTIVLNLCYTGLFVFLLTRMFNNERIMFNK